MKLTRVPVRGWCVLLFLCLAVCMPDAGYTEAKKEKNDGVPKVQFSELSHDFGVSGQNAELRHTFNFKNTGTGLLLIDKVKAG
jgi:hypothetical protein